MTKPMYQGVVFLIVLLLSGREAPAQRAFLRLDQATVSAGSSTVELQVTNPQSADVTVSSYHLTVIKEKSFLTNLDYNADWFIFDGTPGIVLTDVTLGLANPPVSGIGTVNATTGRFLTGLNVSSAPFVNQISVGHGVLNLLQIAPANGLQRDPRNRLLPRGFINLTPALSSCYYRCGVLLTGLSLTPTGDSIEDGLWRHIDFLQNPTNGHHRHTAVAQSVVSRIASVTQGPTVTAVTPAEATGYTSLQAVTQAIPTALTRRATRVITNLQWDWAATELFPERDRIVFECPLIYDRPPVTVPAGQSAALTIPLPAVTVGDPACLPQPGDRVIIHAANPAGAWVLQAAKTAAAP